MIAPGLRAQGLFLAVLIPAFALAGVGTLWLQEREHAAIEAAFQRDLGGLSLVPPLQDSLRRVDLLTGQYLLSGAPGTLEERRRAVEDLRRVASALSALAGSDEERLLCERLSREVAGSLSEQGQWIERRRAGRLPRADAVRVSARGEAVSGSLEALLRLKEANRARLEQRRRETGGAARTALAALAAAGLAAGALASWLLSRTFVEPALELAAMKTQLVAMVSHEFNNALSIVAGMATLLKDDDPAAQDPKRAQYYSVISAHVKSLAVAARTLLELGRVEAGKLAVRPRPVEAGALARACAGRLEVLWARKGLAVSVEAPSEGAWVRADPDALGLALSNLLGNAIKYTPEKGRVVLSASAADGGLVELAVQDTGIGIDPADRSRILSGYYRTAAGKKAAKGFGVGLALVVAVLQAHGSSLEVAGEPGKGSRFSFRLPAARPPA